MKQIVFYKKTQNGSMNKKYKKLYRTLNYSEHFLIFVSAVSGCVLISVSSSLVGVSVSIAISSVGLKFVH